MKRWKLIPIVLFLFSFTGCVQEYRATEEQTDVVAEYMAGLLLKYDDEYSQGLTPLSEIVNSELTDGKGMVTPESEEEAEGSAEDTDHTDDTASIEEAGDYTLSQIIGESDFELQYSGYMITESYPEEQESTYFSLMPREGYQLLVTTFSVKNMSDKAKTLNLNKEGVTYQLDINVGTVYKPQLSLLENDLQYIDMTIPAGETISAVLIFEVSKGTDVSDINLIIARDKKSEIIEIK